MSGIGSTTSVGNSILTDFEAELQKLEIENDNVVTAYNTKKAAVDQWLKEAKNYGLTDLNGKPLKFETLQEFPPLQKPASYNLSQVMAQIKDSKGHASD